MKDETKAALFCVIAFILGSMFLGCRPVPANYSIQTSIPNVHAHKVSQSVSFKMDFRR